MCAITPVAIHAVEISKFSGADLGEGLDLVGEFAYAVNISGFDRGIIGDAQFVTESVDGFTIESGFTSNLPILFEPEYGDTAADRTLEKIMSTFRGSKDLASPEHVRIDLNVQPGQSYKMQMLFAEYCCDGGFDILVEGEPVVSDFAILSYHSVPLANIRNRTDGVVVTHTLTAIDDQLGVELRTGNSTQRETGHGLIHAITLEEISRLRAGDADQDSDFDQLDLVQVLNGGKYLTDQPATWGEGDWDGAFSGEGDPPRGDGKFDQLDILLAVSERTYLSGSNATASPIVASTRTVRSMPLLQARLDVPAGFTTPNGTEKTNVAIGGNSSNPTHMDVDYNEIMVTYVPEPSTSVLLIVFMISITIPRQLDDLLADL